MSITRKLTAATAVLALAATGVATAADAPIVTDQMTSAAPLPLDEGPAESLCTAQGGVFSPPDESLGVSYTCFVSLVTLHSGQIKSAKKVCENVYGAEFHSFRFQYACQRF